MSDGESSEDENMKALMAQKEGSNDDAEEKPKKKSKKKKKKKEKDEDEEVVEKKDKKKKKKKSSRSEKKEKSSKTKDDEDSAKKSKKKKDKKKDKSKKDKKKRQSRSKNMDEENQEDAGLTMLDEPVGENPESNLDAEQEQSPSRKKNSILEAATSKALRPFVIISSSYLLFTITDGAIRMIVLLHAYNKAFSALQVAIMFTLYELAGVFTNLVSLDFTA